MVASIPPLLSSIRTRAYCVTYRENCGSGNRRRCLLLSFHYPLLIINNNCLYSDSTGSDTWYCACHKGSIFRDGANWSSHLGSVGYYLEAGNAASSNTVTDPCCPYCDSTGSVSPCSGTLCHWDQVRGLCLGIARWDPPPKRRSRWPLSRSNLTILRVP